MRLTRNFTLGEAVVSVDHPDLVPEPDELRIDELIAIMRVAYVLQELRDEVGRIHVNSWLRRPPLNEAVGGTAGGRHESGLAVDFSPVDLSAAGVFEGIARKDLPNGFDRLAWYPGGHLHGDLDEELRVVPRRELYINGIEGVPGWTKVPPVDAVRYATGYRREGILRRASGVEWV